VRDQELGLALRALDVPEHGPDFFPELRERLVRRRRFAWPRLLPAAAAVAAAVVVAVLAFDATRTTDVASAAEVRAAVANALTSVSALSGVVRVREGRGEVRWRFLLTDRGDFRLKGLDHPTDLAYDAGEHVERYSDVGYFTERSGVAPGWPDSDSGDWVVQRGLGSAVRALDADGDPEVRETTYDGRPAWTLVTDTGNAGEVREITVDRETGVPVKDVVRFRGRLVQEWRLEGLRVNPPVGPDAFRLERRPNQALTRYDSGFRRVALADVEGEVGYSPLLPRWLPEAFVRSDVAVAARSRRTGYEQDQNPVSRHVVSISYRRGLDEVVVTTRLVGDDRSAWTDPVAMGILSRPPEPVTIPSGVLEGARGELVVDPNAVPHVWAIGGELVVTVAGDLDRGQLLRVAGSLN
jgi:hypothetical protein